MTCWRCGRVDHAAWCSMPGGCDHCGWSPCRWWCLGPEWDQAVWSAGAFRDSRGRFAQAVA